MRDYYDRSSKWMIDRHGDSILRMGGAADIESWRSLPAELVQPRQLPDGLLEVRVKGRQEPDLHMRTCWRWRRCWRACGIMTRVSCPSLEGVRP